MQKLLSIIIITASFFLYGNLAAQQKKDSAAATIKTATDTTTLQKKKFDPRVATRRSAMIPGWGQIYNKKYWKLPLVYGGLGITAGVFVYNVKTYKALRLAFIYKTDTIPDATQPIDPDYQAYSANSIRTARNAVRQNVDYSVLFFILFWGLQVVDATVDAHLKGFDVNDNLSLELKQGYSPMANTTGLSLVLDIHPKKFKSSK